MRTTQYYNHHSYNRSHRSDHQSPFFTGPKPRQFSRSPEREGQRSFFETDHSVQPKISVGRAGDKYEHQANTMADKVVQTLNNRQATHETPGPENLVQSKCEACTKDEDLNTKLQMQAEEEPELQTQIEEEEPVQMQEEEEQMQRQTEEEETVQAQLEDEETLSPMLQARFDSPAKANLGLQQTLAQSSGQGFSLGDSNRHAMEAAFGADFRGVRIHTDARAVQMNQQLGAQAFTHGRDIYFNHGKYNPGTSRGQHLLAHELTHVIQQNGQQNNLQRKLRVEGGYPNYLINRPGNIAQQDPAFSLTPAQRFNFVNGLIQKLCPDFQVNNSSGEVSPQGQLRSAAEISAGGKPAGCCCLFVLTRPSSTTDWRILISGTVSPHTFSAKQAALEGFALPAPDQHNSIVIPSPNAEIEYGHFTAADKRHIMEAEIILAHELCGHASLMEMEAHPETFSRLDTNVHDPTVNVQNLIDSEQGAPASDLRGLAAGNIHRGESFAKVIARGYPINRVSAFSLPANERGKLDLVARLVQTSDFYVDIVGHTDPSGTQAINDRISRQRAQSARNYLLSKGVSRRRHLDADDNTTPLVDRFTDLSGVRDRFPPTANLGSNPDNWRRVEVFLAKFPAGTTNPPNQTPTNVNPVPVPAGASNLARGGNACEKLLVRTAWKGRIP